MMQPATMEDDGRRVMDYIACAEDAAAIRRERLLDLAQRLCSQGYPDLTDRRKARLWSQLEPFLETCLEDGATGWEENCLNRNDLPGDFFREHFYDRGFDVTDQEYERGKENRFFSTLSYFARLAFDAVSGFPGGTYGLSIGDFKRIYGGQIPAWWSDGEWQDQAGNPVDLNTLEDNVKGFI